MNDIKVMNHAADNIRILAASMVEKAKSGHPGGAMGGADFVNVLYSEYLQYDPENPKWEGRDRFFLDPGHMSPMLYSQLALAGKFTIDELKEFRQWGSPTPGHPEVDVMRGIENTSGPLGQGHVFAVGAAIAAKFLATRTGNPTFAKETIYAYISDGGIQEEISQGAGRIAGHLGLDNLIMFFDSNDIQLSTETKDVISEDTAMKYRAWGWNVLEINGNDCQQIREALDAAKKEDKRPTLIIGKCIMGKGARQADNSSYENSCKTHGAPLGGDAYKNTIINLGGDVENPFVIWDDVKELYAKRAEELKQIAAERHAEEEAWANANPEKAAQQKEWFSGKAPKVNWEAIQQKANDATRNASATVLGVLAQEVPNMIVGSADLSNSDKTDGFLKKTHAIMPGDFSGAFFQAGVAELTMACVCIGMALHGGVIAGCGTFFVFSDYMKPAIRMAALMQLPVNLLLVEIYVGIRNAAVRDLHLQRFITAVEQAFKAAILLHILPQRHLKLKEKRITPRQRRVARQNLRCRLSDKGQASIALLSHRQRAQRLEHRGFTGTRATDIQEGHLPYRGRDAECPCKAQERSDFWYFRKLCGSQPRGK